MGTPFKMKGSPMARNFGINAESPVKQVAVVKKGVQLAAKYGKKAYNKVKKVFKGNKAKSNESTYFNTGTGRYQSTKPKGGNHKTGDTYSETYPHYRTNR